MRVGPTDRDKAYQILSMCSLLSNDRCVLEHLHCSMNE
jgi:hypothetical protein